MVRDNSLWCDIPPVGCESQPTTKRPKPNESMGSANAHINLDDDEDVDGQHDRDGPRIYYEPDRPTRKGKRSVASSSSHEELIQQMAEFNSFNKEESQQRFRLQEEKLRVLQEEKDARMQLMRRQQQALDEQQKAVDLEFMMKDHTIYQEPMLQLILDRKREIAACWGFAGGFRRELVGSGEVGDGRCDCVKSIERLATADGIVLTANGRVVTADRTGSTVDGI
ncbi:hypothetical protein R6Q59_010946 [Mikania micrantha]